MKNSSNILRDTEQKLTAEKTVQLKANYRAMKERAKERKAAKTAERLKAKYKIQKAFWSRPVTCCVCERSVRYDTVNFFGAGARMNYVCRYHTFDLETYEPRFDLQAAYHIEGDGPSEEVSPYQEVKQPLL